VSTRVAAGDGEEGECKSEPWNWEGDTKKSGGRGGGKRKGPRDEEHD